MNITINEFVLEHVFNHFPGEDDYEEFWWTAVKHESESGGEGYIMLWADGNLHHTYYNPSTMISDYYYEKGLPEPKIDDRV